MSNGREKINQMITSRMIERITELGELPWRRPWTSVSMWPRNLITKKRYRGVNVFMLHSLGYASPYFLTMKQVNALGGKVRKGEKACPVVFWMLFEPEDEKAPKDDPKSRRHAMLRYYHVFNVAQCDGIPEKKVPTVKLPEREVSPIETAESLVEGMPMPPNIVNGRSMASYTTVTDVVSMPNQEWFKSDEEYYATLFHELAHSTGHQSRLSRKTIVEPNGFGTNPYAKEELVAEMTAAFLAGHCGILPAVEQNSAAYLMGWLKRLHEDSSLLISAGSQAQRAFDYIVGAEFSDEPAENSTAVKSGSEGNVIAA